MDKKAYNGNPNLKQVGYPVQYDQLQVSELIKCSQDPIYFIKNYCYIVSLDHGLVKFSLYPYQEKFITVLHNERRVISMQPRQMGKSQTVAAYILWYTLFNSNKQVAILANKASAAREILSRFQLMYENLPLWLQQGVKVWNKGDIELENGSKVLTAATSASGIRGKSINLLYVDETAIVPNTVAEEFFTATYPVVSAGETTKIVLTSTPLGYNHFWKFWNEAEQGLNGFVPLKVNYWEHPKRDEAWAENQRKLLGDVKFNQEVLCAFLGSAYTLISGDVLSRLSAIQPLHSKNNLDVYEEPIGVERDDKGKITKQAHVYAIVCDVSRGIDGDYSAFTVVDISEMPYKVVAKYRDNKVSTLLYPNIIYKVAKDYNNAYVLIEIKEAGLQVADILYGELEYENVLFVGKGKSGQHVTSGFGTSGAQPGVMTSAQVKRIGCATFKTLVEENKLLIPDSDIISEISTFVQRKNTYAADDGYHDDLVMTLVLFAWMTNSSYFKELSNVNMREHIFEERINQIEDSLTPFGIIDNGQEEETFVDSSGTVWNVQTGEGFFEGERNWLN